MPTKEMFEKRKFAPLPAGVYEVEIIEAKHKEFKKKDDTIGEKANFRAEIVSPKEHEGKTWFFDMWYDDRLGKMLESVGKGVDDLFDGKTFKPEKVGEIFNGKFLKLRIGVKNEYNEVVETIIDSKEEV